VVITSTSFQSQIRLAVKRQACIAGSLVTCGTHGEFDEAIVTDSCNVGCCGSWTVLEYRSLHFQAFSIFKRSRMGERRGIENARLFSQGALVLGKVAENSPSLLKSDSRLDSRCYLATLSYVKADSPTFRHDLMTEILFVGRAGTEGFGSARVISISVQKRLLRVTECCPSSLRCLPRKGRFGRSISDSVSSNHVQCFSAGVPEPRSRFAIESEASHLVFRFGASDRTSEIPARPITLRACDSS